MAAPSLTWTIKLDSGTINFGRTFPFAGNTYELSLIGTIYEQEYTVFVMSDDGIKCLAKSKKESSGYSIAFNGTDLREEFERDMHEMRPFHCVIRDSEKTVAEGDLTIEWNPLWTDIETGEVYTMRGPEGKPGATGKQGDKGENGKNAYQIAVDHGYSGTEEEWLKSLRGLPGLTTAVYSDIDSKWHPIKVSFDVYNKPVVEVESEGQEISPEGDIYVTIEGNQNINGTKTFTTSPIVPKANDSDNSNKAANTSWVRDRISNWWESIISVAANIYGMWNFESLSAVNSNFFGAETHSGTETHSGSETHSGTETHLGRETHSGTETHSGAETHLGTETHSGAETHLGTETHSGTITITGQFDASNVKEAEIGISIDKQSSANAMSEKMTWDLVAMVAPYLNSNWVYFDGDILPEGYNGSTEGSISDNKVIWRNPGINSVVSGDSVASGLCGFKTVKIEKYACYYPNYLKRIFFPNTKTIEKYAFYKASYLEKIDIPLCESIREYAFFTCSKLVNFNAENAIKIPKCKFIGTKAFYDSLGSVSNFTIEIGTEATIGTTEAEYNSIGEEAFNGIGNTKISRIILPTTQIIHKKAFYDHRQVLELRIPEVIEIGESAFAFINYGKTDNEWKLDIDIPKCVKISKAAFSLYDPDHTTLHGVKSINAPKCEEIGEGAFYYQRSLSFLNQTGVPDFPELRKIGKKAFSHCLSLSSVKLPKVEIIEEEAFAYDSVLIEAVIDKALQIGENVFKSCSELNNIYIREKTREEIKMMSNFPFGRNVVSCKFYGSNGWVDGQGNFG